MAARSAVYLAHVDQEGDVLANRAVTITRADGSPLGVPLYDVVSGGTPVAAPKTDAQGSEVLYADFVGRVKVTYDGTTAPYDDAFWPDPADVLVNGGSGSLPFTFTGGLAVSSSHPTDAAGSFRHRLGAVSFVHAVAYGSGYTSAPTVTFAGGGGTGATGVAVVNTGGVIGVSLTAAGSGYTSAPTVSLTGGGGSGAIMRAEMAAEPFEVLDLDGQRAFYVDGTNTRVPIGKKLAIGNGIALENTDFIVSCIDDHIHRTLADFVYYNNYVGGSGEADVSTVRIVAQQGSGNAYNRPLEVHMLANSGTSALPKLAIEATSQASYLGNGLDRTGVISMRNLGNVWGVPTPQRLDFGLLIGGDQQGFVNGILYQDTHAMGDATLFKVDQLGFVTANGLLFLHQPGVGPPPAGSLRVVSHSDDKLYKVTNAGDEVMILDTDLMTAAGQLLYSIGNENPAALPAPTAGQLLVGSAGGLPSWSGSVLVAAGGELDFRASQNVSPGGGAAATMAGAIGGSGPATATFAGWLRHRVNGTAVFLPYWV